MNDLSKYIDWIEVQTFFPGFILLYAAIQLFSSRSGFVKIKLLPLLPFAYAFTGLLFTGMLLNNYITGFTINGSVSVMELPALKLFAITSLLFFIPALGKRIYLCLIHSLVFFFLLLKSSYLDTSGFDSANNVKIFSVSILLNLASLLMIITFKSIYISIKNHFINRKVNDKVHYTI